jgi:hypothetical protein
MVVTDVADDLPDQCFEVNPGIGGDFSGVLNETA